jgi:hypothetical protein
MYSKLLKRYTSTNLGVLKKQIGGVSQISKEAYQVNLRGAPQFI